MPFWANESEKALVAYSILQRLTELFDKSPQTDTKPRLMVVVDEAWQLFKREKEYSLAKESVAEKIVRLGRKYGIGIIVSTQQLDDVPKVFFNSCSLMMIHQHRESSYYGKDIIELNRFEKEYMKNAAQGEFLLFNRAEAQGGIGYNEYIKGIQLTSDEIKGLESKAIAYLPVKISEPELPIEEDGVKARIKN